TSSRLTPTNSAKPQNHWSGARMVNTVIAIDWSRPIAAPIRVCQPSNSSVPAAASTTNTCQPKIEKCGMTTWAMNRRSGSPTAYCSACRNEYMSPRGSSRPKSGGSFQVRLASHSTPMKTRRPTNPQANRSKSRTRALYAAGGGGGVKGVAAAAGLVAVQRGSPLRGASREATSVQVARTTSSGRTVMPQRLAGPVEPADDLDASRRSRSAFRAASDADTKPGTMAASGAAQESNLPTVGLQRPAGFEGRL